MEEQKKEIETKAPAPSALSPEKRGSRKRLNHPKYSDMIVTAPVGSTSNRHLSLTLKNMMERKDILRTKGTGAAGSFKLNKAAGKVKGASRGKGGKKRKPTKRKKPLQRRTASRKRKSPVRRRKARRSVGRRPMRKSQPKLKKKKKAKRRL